MTNKQKRGRVAAALRQARARSDRAIAAECEVSAPFVAKVRQEVGLVSEVRRGGDGRRRRVPQARQQLPQLLAGAGRIIEIAEGLIAHLKRGAEQAAGAAQASALDRIIALAKGVARADRPGPATPPACLDLGTRTLVLIGRRVELAKDKAHGRWGDECRYMELMNDADVLALANEPESALHSAQELIQLAKDYFADECVQMARECVAKRPAGDHQPPAPDR